MTVWFLPTDGSIYGTSKGSTSKSAITTDVFSICSKIVLIGESPEGADVSGWEKPKNKGEDAISAPQPGTGARQAGQDNPGLGQLLE